MKKAALCALVALLAGGDAAAASTSTVLSRSLGMDGPVEEGLLTKNGVGTPTSRRVALKGGQTEVVHPKPLDEDSDGVSKQKKEKAAGEGQNGHEGGEEEEEEDQTNGGDLQHVVSLDGSSQHPLPGTEAAEEVPPAHSEMPTRFPPRMPNTLPAAPPTAEQIKAGARRPYVCLTFDDGPNGATKAVADAVAEVGGKADFYFNCHHTQKELFERAMHLVKGGHGVQSHQCDHATVRSPATSPFKEHAWPSMANYAAVYGNRKQYTPKAGNCFKGKDALRGEVLTNYGDTVRRYVKAFADNGATLPRTEMTLARLPGDGRFYKCLTGAIEQTKLADFGHADAVSASPYHSGWQFEVAPTYVKWGHLKHTGHLGVEGVRASEAAFPGDGDIILLHEAHWRKPASLAALKQWLTKLKDNFFDMGRINPANGRCERWAAPEASSAEAASAPPQE